MFSIVLTVLALAVASGSDHGQAGVTAASKQNRGEPVAPMLTGLGDLHMPVTTSVPRAQQFFNQGVRLLYAFNHQESQRAFREAARLDPSLAMAYWGQAMTLGPTLNSPMPAASVTPAYDAIMRARTLAAAASPRERALIEALAARYAAKPPADRSPLDRAYAEAMRGVAARFPGDPDVQVLFADAVMNTMPWDYWKKDGSAKPDTTAALDAVERSLAAFPDHAGAHHYLIHLMEASNDPDRAEKSADRLGALMPAAGHMVHMPAHIYIRVGRYADASEANVRAIAADEDYLAQCQAQGLYPVSYYPHNLHFLWAAATFEGRSAVAIEAARSVAEKTPHHHAGALAWTTDFPVTPLLAWTRFGQWKRILTEPAPPASEPYATGIWRYARAMAFIAGDRLDRAELELAELSKTMTHEAFKTTFKDLPLLINLTIASRMTGGELAAARGRFDEAVALAREAVTTEDALPYSEPPIWHHPPRQVLGAILLEAGRAADAERVYREDLARFRENGWSLFGLMQSLSVQGRTADAAAVRARFEKAWKRADIALASSRVLRAGAIADVQTMALPGGVTVEYVDRGARTGTPIVFLHGVTDSWRSFEGVLAQLPASVRALAISQRGHGRSSQPKDYRLKDFAADVRALLDALEIPSAVIVGHSMGAMVAQRFALDYPGRTSKLVLMGSFANMRASAAVNELWRDAIGPMRDPVDPVFVRAFQEGTVVRPTPAGFIDMAVRESLRVPARVWRSAFAEFLRTDYTNDLSRLTVPTLIVWGDRDNVVPPAATDALRAAIPGAQLVVYPGAGHAFHWEDSTQFTTDLMAFVRQERD